MVPFEHYIVELSLKDITTAKGEKVTVCEIQSNMPLECEEDQSGHCYRWDRVIPRDEPFSFESGCFCFILVPHCHGDVGVFAIGHSVPEVPSFQTLLYEGNKLVRAESSNVAMNQKADFDFSWFNAGQRLRIETIPDL